MKFRYNGEMAIRDIGLSFRKRDGADITGITDDYIIKKGSIIETTDEECIAIMKTNPNYELIIEETKKEKPKKVFKKEEPKKLQKEEKVKK